MKARARVERLRQLVGRHPTPGQLDLVVAVPVGSGMADDLPPGVHFNTDRRVVTVVFAGTGPNPVVMAELETHLAEYGMVITSAAGSTAR